MKDYPSDLTDKQWKLIAPLIPPPKHGGRPRKTNERLIVDALLYISRTGCQWDISRKSTHQDQQCITISKCGEKIALGIIL